MAKSKGCGTCNCQSTQKTKSPKIDHTEIDRRQLLKGMGLAATAGITSSLGSGCSPAELVAGEEGKLKWEEYFKKNYRVMSEKERDETVERLERLYEIRNKGRVNIGSEKAQENVLYGYAFNISKCRGYMDCVEACIKENNQDRDSEMAYITIHESKNGRLSLESSNSEFVHEVPAEGHFYFGTQCFHCENAPCIDVCPTKATWQEPDGIVVVDYDWCIGCRYCEAACPYFGRRFNWKEPHVPDEQVNRDQHYLGNRLRSKGVMEKCTFCIQRSRKGKNPACVEACPTGARIFGNLLDPNSEIRWVLKNKKVFRLKEELGTEPKFWYFMD